MFSFSFYFSEPLEQIEKKFQQASAFRCTELFTSLHIPEDDFDKYREKLALIGEFAKRYGVGVVADVTPTSLAKLGISGERLSVLRGWGISGLRLDDGFSMKDAAQFSHQLKVVLNASTLTESECDELAAYSANWDHIEAWHNFYPRPETGLAKDAVVEKNNMLRQKGLRKIAAFIAGNKEKRGPLYEGLPTLEAHRFADPLCAYVELVQDCGVDKVFVGDIAVTDDALMRIKEFQGGVLPLRYQPLAPYDWLALVETVHTNRRDAARDVIRSAESRLSLAWPDDALRPANTIRREKGSVTIDNNQYGRYAGELQITLVDLPANGKVNVVGRIMEDDLPLLAYVGGGQRFRLMRAT
jgi:uncharacterized protein